jgi:capsular polysaccharide biosynthesis protein
MELRDYIGILGRRKWVIILTFLFTVAVVTIGALQTPAKYTASTQIRVLTTKTGGSTYVDYNVEYAERLVATYVKIATSNPIIEELSRHVNISPDDILKMVKVEIIPNTELFQISVESIDPGLSQYMANKLAQIIITQSKQL